MALLAWKKDYSVKVRQFDDQHRKLIDMVNKLHEAMKLGKGSQVVNDVLSSLAAYTQTHFSDEERLMLYNGYPGYLDHKKKHDQLVSRVRDFQRQVEIGEATVSLGLMNFLKDWLLQHIQVVDMQYGPYLNGKGIA
jgi:hemerythrin